MGVQEILSNQLRKKDVYVWVPIFTESSCSIELP
jgi:hypothetical protein